MLYVGDPNQRLSTAALPAYAGALRISMSYTFRFGPDVAEMCNDLVDECPLMFGFGETLRDPPVMSERLALPSAAEELAVVGFANKDVFRIAEGFLKRQRFRKVEFLSRKLVELRKQHMDGHRGSGRLMMAGTIHSVKGMTFKDKTVIVHRGRIRSPEEKRRYLVSLSRIQSGGRSKLYVYDDPRPAAMDRDDEWDPHVDDV